MFKNTRSLTVVALTALAAFPAIATAAPLQLGTTRLDRPTLTALGVQQLITGDENYNARIDVRYRRLGDSTWRSALPLMRVQPDPNGGWPIQVVPQFAGSIFNLVVATTYEIELHAVDPDGLNQTVIIQGTTRAVPSDPPAPRVVPVTSAAALSSALAAARAGDIISLANGSYAGPFSLSASGAAGNPIVIRGATQTGTVVSGGIAIAGSYVHIERLTIQNAYRGINFSGNGATSNVVRRVSMSGVFSGIDKSPRYSTPTDGNQTDFYICDNDFQGPHAWPIPAVWEEAFGIAVEGHGFVVCHNKLSGFDDALKTTQTGARANDFIGNDVVMGWDNGIELDDSAGNVRALQNRFSNTREAISFQPIYGGPAYAVRNVVLNAQASLKINYLGGTPPQLPSGAVVLHNTFLAGPVGLYGGNNRAYNYWLSNNLFYGISNPPQGYNVFWNPSITAGTLDYNAYWPDGVFRVTLAPVAPDTTQVWSTTAFSSFAALQTASAVDQLGRTCTVERHGVVTSGGDFASGLGAPASNGTLLPPPIATLSSGSRALDRGLVLPNVNDGYLGTGPDMGALERGCTIPIYGPRPEGMDERNETIGCGNTLAPSAPTQLQVH